ncbi:MAG: hypothetical protein HY901_21270, partial [Deltaproteobacteria bacterium]|nr:hypothetical protein [Deltaproteobacteria bacterium]
SPFRGRKVASFVDQRVEPSRLSARVVAAGSPPRLFGYDVEGDLARHYGFSDTVALLLGGDLAEPEKVRAIEVALIFLSPVSVAEAPAHAGLLSRICGAPFSATLAIATIALSEEAAFTLEEHREWLTWLSTGDYSEPPARFVTQGTEDSGVLERLAAALPPGFAARALAVRPKRTAAVLAVLHTAGLSPEAMQTYWVVARLPAVAAEAAATRLLGMKEYPFNLPPLDYREEEEE